MGRGAIALLLIPSLAFGDAPTASPLTPRLKEMTTPQLLEEYETLERQRPGIGGPIGVVGAGTGLTFIGLLAASVRTTRTVNGMTVTTRGSSNPVSWVLLGLGIAGLLAGGLWFVLNLRKRLAVGENLEAVQAELDVRERAAPTATAIAESELLAMLAAPTPLSTGSLVVMVSDGKGPVSGAAIAIGDKVFTSDERGAAVIEGLKPGPVSLAVSAAGHLAADEAASVVAGVRTAVRLQLKANLEVKVARLTGVVRSHETGDPVPAQLEVAETKAQAKVDAQGMFRVDVPGGDYTVRISAPGYQTQTKQVRVKPGERAIFNVDLYAR